MSPDQNYSRDDVFGVVLRSKFSADEAAEYLEISAAALQALVQDGILAPVHTDGQLLFFSAHDLKALKREAQRSRYATVSKA